MKDIRKREFSSFKGIERSGPGIRLWCGKVQDLCDGSLCSPCHMFPVSDVKTSSILSTPSLTDLKNGNTLTDDEE